jgi:hypothetical protein
MGNRSAQRHGSASHCKAYSHAEADGYAGHEVAEKFHGNRTQGHLYRRADGDNNALACRQFITGRGSIDWLTYCTIKTRRALRSWTIESPLLEMLSVLYSGLRGALDRRLTHPVNDR